MTEPESVETVDEKPLPTVETVEAMVRAQMAKALGGKRGIIEAAIPGLLFTILWLTTKDLRLALVVGGAGVGIALVARLVQRSTVQYVFNAAFSIAIGYVFTRIAANAGGDASDQALAYFPGSSTASATRWCSAPRRCSAGRSSDSCSAASRATRWPGTRTSRW
jgi:uncharacterized protein DUF3159